jgi:hypothetical protein
MKLSLQRTISLGLLGVVIIGALDACDILTADDVKSRPITDGGQRAHADGTANDASASDSSQTAACPTLAQGECTTFPLCGCSSSENCVFKNSKPTCAPAGPKTINQPCALGDASTIAEECARGYICTGAPQQAEGVCTAYCQQASDCPMRIHAWRCEAPDTFNTKLCFADCDPRETAVCGPDALCVLLRPFQDDNPSLCMRAGAGGVGAGCTYDFDCAAGHWCSGGFCRRWCQVILTVDAGSTECGGKRCLRTTTNHPRKSGVELGGCEL